MMFKCNACGTEWNDPSTTHSCYGYPNSPPNATAVYSKLDRIIELLEGDKSFAGEILERLYIETVEVNRNLIRLIYLHESPDNQEKYREMNLGQARPLVTSELHYPLIGDEPHVETDFGQTVEGLQPGETISYGPGLVSIGAYQKLVEENADLRARLESRIALRAQVDRPKHLFEQALHCYLCGLSEEHHDLKKENQNA